ncbi:MAG: quinone oxidoreductase [Bifidobacteriaceae bacterium]|jgi:NADPH2:quinone reductase|nr:quinone oxidoreductase [Bifidobacteriaceae bacterium]
MRAITAQLPGVPEVLVPTEVPLPTPGPGEVLVKVAAAGVNFIDTYLRSGVYRTPFPIFPGSEGAGLIEQLGDGTEEFSLGQPVAWANSLTGSYAEYALVAASQVLPLPPGLPLETAAALPLQGMTADYLTRSTYGVTRGTQAVIYAAAGGVGGLATQMALAAGARVIATVGTADKIATVEAFGVEPSDIIVLGAMSQLERQLPQAILERTNLAGADVIYDGIGQTTFRATLAALRPRGMAVLYGGASGQVEPFDPQELNAHGSLYLTRPKLGDYSRTRQELLDRAGRVLQAAVSGDLVVRIGQRFALTNAVEAHRAIESGLTQGKILLIPGATTWDTPNQ